MVVTKDISSPQEEVTYDDSLVIPVFDQRAGATPAEQTKAIIGSTLKNAIAADVSGGGGGGGATNLGSGSIAANGDLRLPTPAEAPLTGSLVSFYVDTIDAGATDSTAVTIRLGQADTPFYTLARADRATVTVGDLTPRTYYLGRFEGLAANNGIVDLIANADHPSGDLTRITWIGQGPLERDGNNNGLLTLPDAGPLVDFQFVAFGVTANNTTSTNGVVQLRIGTPAVLYRLDVTVLTGTIRTSAPYIGIVSGVGTGFETISVVDPVDRSRQLPDPLGESSGRVATVSLQGTWVASPPTGLDQIAVENLVNALRPAVRQAPDPSSATDGQVVKVASGAYVLAADEVGQTGSGEANPAAATETEAEEGTVTQLRSWSPSRVHEAIDAAVADWAEAGNANSIPTAKLANALTATGIPSPEDGSTGQILKINADGNWGIGDDNEGSGGGGVSDYDDLTDKPIINVASVGDIPDPSLANVGTRYQDTSTGRQYVSVGIPQHGTDRVVNLSRVPTVAGNTVGYRGAVGVYYDLPDPSSLPHGAFYLVRYDALHSTTAFRQVTAQGGWERIATWPGSGTYRGAFLNQDEAEANVEAAGDIVVLGTTEANVEVYSVDSDFVAGTPGSTEYELRAVDAFHVSDAEDPLVPSDVRDWALEAETALVPRNRLSLGSMSAAEASGGSDTNDRIVTAQRLAQAAEGQIGRSERVVQIGQSVEQLGIRTEDLQVETQKTWHVPSDATGAAMHVGDLGGNFPANATAAAALTYVTSFDIPSTYHDSPTGGSQTPITIRIPLDADPNDYRLIQVLGSQTNSIHHLWLSIGSDSSWHYYASLPILFSAYQLRFQENTLTAVGTEYHGDVSHASGLPTGVPTGGTDGQLLARDGTTALEWVDAPSGGGGSGGGGSSAGGVEELHNDGSATARAHDTWHDVTLSRALTEADDNKLMVFTFHHVQPNTRSVRVVRAREYRLLPTNTNATNLENTFRFIFPALAANAVTSDIGVFGVHIGRKSGTVMRYAVANSGQVEWFSVDLLTPASSGGGGGASGVSSWALTENADDLQDRIPWARVDPDVPSQTEAELGTSAVPKAWTSARVRQAINSRVSDWAEHGNTSAIPAEKLTNAPSGGAGGGASGPNTGARETLHNDAQPPDPQRSAHVWHTFNVSRALVEADDNKLLLFNFRNQTRGSLAQGWIHVHTFRVLTASLTTTNDLTNTIRFRFSELENNGLSDVGSTSVYFRRHTATQWGILVNNPNQVEWFSVDLLTPASLGGAGLTEAQVDARVVAGVEDWAETGNAAAIPAAKLENAGDARPTVVELHRTSSIGANTWGTPFTVSQALTAADDEKRLRIRIKYSANRIASLFEVRAGDFRALDFQASDAGTNSDDGAWIMYVRRANASSLQSNNGFAIAKLALRRNSATSWQFACTHSGSVSLAIIELVG